MTDSEIKTGPNTGGTSVHVHVAPQDTAAAVASLVLGIFALCTVWIPFFGLIAWVLAPLGLILGLVALNRPASSGRAVALVGTICSGLALLGCIGWVVLIGFAAAS